MGPINIVQLLISLVSGAVGGNAAGAAMKEKSLGTLGNSLAGIFGGGIGGIILQMLGLAPGGEGLDLTSIITNVAGSGVGGALLLAIVSFLKQGTAKKA